MALAGLGATVGASTTKAALAAASAGVIGAKAAIDKDVLYQQTILAIVTEMDALRTQTYADIVDRMTQDVTKYSLESASRDIQTYYNDGSIVNALQAINKSASDNKETSKKNLAKVLGRPVE